MRKLFATRLSLAVATGAMVAAVSLVGAWQEFAGSGFFHMARFVTELQMQRLDAEIVSYRDRHGRLPAALADLLEQADSEVEPDGTARDRWGEPVVYSVVGDRYSLLSLGADGQRGGKLDSCDIELGQPLPPEAFPTLIEFYADEQAAGMAKLSCASGILAGLAALLAIQARDLGRTGIRSLVLKLLLVTGASLALAAVLSTLELPSGH